MNRKKQLKKEIDGSRNEISELESKIIRSQSALMEAIITHTKPDDKDIEYFRLLTSLIKVERENLQKLYEELKELEKKK